MSASEESDVALTLVIPLRAKATMSLPDFYQYWLNAHVTLPPRFPGISSIWLHVVSFDHQLWPRLPGVSHRPEPEDEFHGVPEATFPTMADLELFQSYAHVQMVDGINFLGEVITYSSVGNNSATVVDKLDDAAPDGHDNMVRHLLFLRRRADVPAAELHHPGRGARVAIADLIRRLGADSQREAAVSALFLPELAGSPARIGGPTS